MQIKSLIFYNRQGDKRILSFELGKVNIITGESKTGKTAIIDIINYCLCSDDCRISEGIIRDTVEWFGILLQLDAEQIFIARQNPNRLNQASTQYIHFENADTIKIPELSELNNNSDINTLKDFLTKKLFIAEFTNVPDSGTRAPLTVNFKHSRYYSYQPQDLIAQRNYLFYNQSDPFIAQSIKDTLPYFLGVLREDTYRLEQEISAKKRELAKYEKELKEYERLKQDGGKKIFEFVEESKQLDLLPVDQQTEDESSALVALREVLKWETTFNETAEGENENLKKIIEEKNELIKELGRINDDVKAVKIFINQTSDYSDEATQQKVRLESIQLFGETEAELHNCPLCSQTIDTTIPSIEAINRSLSQISENLTNTIQERPKLGSYIEKLTSNQDDLKKQIELKQNSIKAIYTEQEQAGRLKDLNLRRGKTIGKISLFLESLHLVEEDKTLHDKIQLLKAKLSELEQQIGSEEKESRLNAVLNHINTQMTNWAANLDIEHQNSPIRFDIKKLTIFIDTLDRSIPLSNMGSGANWLAAHLLIHFALHQYFVKTNRPVPRFLVLDQPSQIYFPPEKDINQTGEINESSDEAAVRQMYDFIFNVTESLSPSFQVIITDHAKLKTEQFKTAIIEEWRNGIKLIPVDWIQN
ncbi:DUF3732 domain-containing protein [Chryseobacterium sp. MEBOG07]|uniref:DUF3732 domain-containing protein n=1 Tax=Chryseobacterium sp. MEBOG07 TaxID=2879939 RepID=UPI001F460D4E|nr:DUF3732 domain-containing protein [Chryseobacterium sp. MEBOG07]UKB77364.1 DUF3732 domain-containing protein [Chryseobacterium sp. MEBOG07]